MNIMRNISGLFPVGIAPQSKSIADIALSTGWWELDQIYRPYPGQLTVVTGKPGHGKSTFIFNLILNLCKQHHSKAFFYVPENEQYIREQLERIHGGDPDDFKLMANDSLFLQASGYEHYGDEPHTIDWVLDSAAGAMQLKGVDVVMIDPWNQLERARRKDENLTDYIGECLSKMANFARITQAIVFIVAHPTKAASERDVTLADIEGSMNWWNKCDNGLIVKREPRSSTVISAKVRMRGAGRLGWSVWHVNDNEQFIPEHGAVTFA